MKKKNIFLLAALYFSGANLWFAWAHLFKMAIIQEAGEAALFHWGIFHLIGTMASWMAFSFVED